MIGRRGQHGVAFSASVLVEIAQHHGLLSKEILERMFTLSIIKWCIVVTHAWVVGALALCIFKRIVDLLGERDSIIDKSF